MVVGFRFAVLGRRFSENMCSSEVAAPGGLRPRSDGRAMLTLRCPLIGLATPPSNHSLDSGPLSIHRPGWARFGPSGPRCQMVILYCPDLGRAPSDTCMSAASQPAMFMPHKGSSDTAAHKRLRWQASSACATKGSSSSGHFEPSRGPPKCRCRLHCCGSTGVVRMLATFCQAALRSEGRGLIRPSRCARGGQGRRPRRRRSRLKQVRSQARPRPRSFARPASIGSVASCLVAFDFNQPLQT